MDLSLLKQQDECRWLLPATGDMRVPGILFGSREIIGALEPEAAAQVRDVACLPGIVTASLAMPDAHQGYGFPIGGVAAFDPKKNGVVSAGGVGFDIACGVRCLTTDLSREEVLPVLEDLADDLYRAVPSGVGGTGRLVLDEDEMDRMLRRGASWAVEMGYGEPRDLSRTEEGGFVPEADPSAVSREARKRARDQMGTLGSGNHYLEIQAVEEILDPDKARIFGLRRDEVLVGVHCGSRGLGHQIATEFLARMVSQAPAHGIRLPNRDLACAPVRSDLGQEYLGAMRAGINFALANRQVITHLVREVFAERLPRAVLRLLYDVSHNTCKEEVHEVDGRKRRLFVHRKGATRAYGPGHPDLPPDIRPAGQPVLVGGSMGTASYILAGRPEAMTLSFGSACHGAGRALSRAGAKKRFRGADVVESLRRKGVFIRSASLRGIAEEAPQAYKDVEEVIDSAVGAGLVTVVARLAPLACIKG